MWSWWNLFTMYLLMCQIRVTVSALRLCFCGSKHQLTNSLSFVIRVPFVSECCCWSNTNSALVCVPGSLNTKYSLVCVPGSLNTYFSLVCVPGSLNMYFSLVCIPGSLNTCFSLACVAGSLNTCFWFIPVWQFSKLLRHQVTVVRVGMNQRESLKATELAL